MNQPGFNGMSAQGFVLNAAHLRSHHFRHVTRQLQQCRIENEMLRGGFLWRRVTLKLAAVGLKCIFMGSPHFFQVICEVIGIIIVAYYNPYITG